MRALPSRSHGDRISKRSGGPSVGRLPEWGGCGPASGVGNVVKEDEITCVDALQASSWAKSKVGTYSTHYMKLALWVGYTPMDDLKTEACRCLFQLSGLG